jgi:hypothetical protein
MLQRMNRHLRRHQQQFGNQALCLLKKLQVFR